MSGSHPSRWITFLVFGAVTAFGCVGTTDTGPQGETGSLSVELVLAGGIEIDEVGWQITGNGMDMSGSIDVTAPRSTASVEVFGLPPGATDYTVMLTATSNDEQVTCEGSAPFNVEVGQSTKVMVMLNCKKPRTLGGVRVNGKFNICTQLTKVVMSPLQTSVGNDISLSAQAFDEEGDAIHYIWSGDGGSIADPSAASTTYTCQDVGDHTVTILVTDNDVYCRMATWTVPVTCVPGDVVDLCEDVECPPDGNQCTEAACDPSSGECVSSNVDDGTLCEIIGVGDGICSNGQCVEIDLCEGVDCDDDNECTADACNPADGTCENTNVDNGTPCADETGMCVDGACMISDLCEGVVCDDTGNDCTVAMCNTATGICDTMNVTDGTECNSGAGACSAGVCIDDNPCEGVDCTSDNDCVQDGTCDPADGLCDPGDPQPADTACDLTGTDDGFCDGVGTCVECNDGAQCPDDGNECTAEACTSNACSTSPVADGTMCDNDGSAGVCMSGVCEDAMLCADAETRCSDGNECTQDLCDPATGNCSNPAEPDGSQCTCPVCGAEGVCDMGVCIDPCDDVDCSDGNECTADLCNVGVCSNPNLGPGAACSQGGGNVCDGAGTCVECINDTQCSGGQTCEGNMCVSGPVDLPEQTLDISLACTNQAQPQMSEIPGTLSVDPGPTLGGSPFTAELTGNLNFPENFLDVATTLLPPNTTTAQIVDLVATVEVRSGATGDNVALPVDPALPTACAISAFACDPANNANNGTNPACLPSPLDTCGSFVNLPLSTDQNVCANLTGALGTRCVGGANAGEECTPGDGSECPGATGFVVQPCENSTKLIELANFGGCITGDLPLPLGDATGNYAAGASGSTLLFGWIDDVGTSGATFKQCPNGSNNECYSTNPGCDLGELTSPVCAVDGPYTDGTNDYWSLPTPSFSAPIGPLATKVNAGLQVAINCVMGAVITPPECETVPPDATCQCNPADANATNPDGCPTMLGNTPDSDLISFTIP